MPSAYALNVAAQRSAALSRELAARQGQPIPRRAVSPVVTERLRAPVLPDAEVAFCQTLALDGGRLRLSAVGEPALPLCEAPAVMVRRVGTVAVVEAASLTDAAVPGRLVTVDGRGRLPLPAGIRAGLGVAVAGPVLVVCQQPGRLVVASPATVAGLLAVAAPDSTLRATSPDGDGQLIDLEVARSQR